MSKILLMLAVTLCFPCFAQQSPQETIIGKPVIPAEKDSSGVVLRLFENQKLENGEGVSIYIDGWHANDRVELLLIGPKEEKRFLTLNNSKLPVTDKGHLEFSFHYDHEALYPGEWVSLGIGKSGTHGQNKCFADLNRISLIQNVIDNAASQVDRFIC